MQIECDNLYSVGMKDLVHWKELLQYIEKYVPYTYTGSGRL